MQSLTLHKFFITIDSAVKKFSYSVKLYRTENQRLCCIILGNRTVSNSTELKSLIGFKPFAFLFVIFEPEVDNQYIIYRTMLPGGAQTEFRNELRFLCAFLAFSFAYLLIFQ